MIKEHIVKDSDTIQRIAYSYYGTVDKWRNIVDYNKLDYPYITEDLDFTKEYYAQGTVRFFIDSPAVDDIVIPAGIILKTTFGTGEYETLSECIIDAGETEIFTTAKALHPGYSSNCSEKSITIIETDGLSDVYVENTEAFTDGMIYNVKKTGEVLYIPLAENNENITESVDEYLESLGQADLYLNRYNDLTTDLYNDLKITTGIEAIMQSLKHRWATSKGALILHPEYGSKLAQLIGRKEPFIEKMIQLDIVETALQENYIEDCVILSYERSGASIHVEVQVTIAGQNTSIQRDLSFTVV